MSLEGVCGHGRVRTLCTLCRQEIPRLPRRSVAAPLPGSPAAQRQRGDARLESFYEALEGYVERERSASYARWKDGLAAPLADRLAGARAIEGVEIAALSHATGAAEWAQLRCTENRSKFRVGTSLLLHKGDPAAAVPCRLLTDGELGFRVGAEFKQRLTNLQVGPGWVLDEGWSDYSENLRENIETLRRSPRKNWICEILAGARRPAYDPERAAEARRLLAGTGLDPDQEEAFVNGMSARSHHLVQGPPGSGKTAVLSRLAAALAARGEKVLVTAVTHRAINHALRTTQRLKQAIDVVKVGGAERSDDGVTTFTSFPDWRMQHPEGDGVVVGATCHTRLPAGLFDTVVFDESSQFPIPLALRGMLAGKRYVFIGDDQQMDPVVVAEHPQEWVAWSVFRLLRQHDAGTMLQTTYRLNAELNAFPSQAFYEGRLRPSPEAAARRIHYRRRPRHWDILDPDVPSVLVEVPHKDATVRSPEEARIAAALALDAIAAGVPPHEVGLITPFRAQERLILSELARQNHGAVPRGLVVETVERVQGQERDLAIVSLTVSDVRYAAEAAEFFFRPSRFNVALTRARSKRIVLMDPGLVHSKAGQPYAAAVAHLRAFYEMTPKRRIEAPAA